MNNFRPPQRSHLFAIRIWEHTTENGRSEWRGRVEHVLTGQVRYFIQWDDLITTIQELLPEEEANNAGVEDTDEWR